METEKQEDEEYYIGRESMSIKPADGQYVSYGISHQYSKEWMWTFSFIACVWA